MTNIDEIKTRLLNFERFLDATGEITTEEGFDKVFVISERYGKLATLDTVPCYNFALDHMKNTRNDMHHLLTMCRELEDKLREFQGFIGKE